MHSQMKREEKRILIGFSLILLLVTGFLWWFVFFQTSKDWWHFDVGERIDTPQIQRFLR